MRCRLPRLKLVIAALLSAALLHAVPAETSRKKKGEPFTLVALPACTAAHPAPVSVLRYTSVDPAGVSVFAAVGILHASAYVPIAFAMGRRTIATSIHEVETVV